MSNTGPGRGIGCDEAPILKACDLQGHRPTMPDAPSQGLMKWNKMNEISVEKWQNEICGKGKPQEKHTQDSTTKATLSDRDMNSGPQQWEASI